jgi:hypothetical protein
MSFNNLLVKNCAAHKKLVAKYIQQVCKLSSVFKATLRAHEGFLQGS